MRIILAIAARELRSYLVSPIAYVIIALFLFIFGAMFWIFTVEFANATTQLYQYAQDPMYDSFLSQMTINSYILRPLFGNIQVVFLLLVPALTMRLFSEEKKQGTYEFLLTSPVTVFQLVIGKYLAAVSMVALLLLCSALYPATLYFLGTPETMTMLAGYLGLMLVAAAFVAVGTLASSLTENQIIAAVLTFASLLCFWIVSWMTEVSGPGTMATILGYLTFDSHIDDFTKGVVDTRHLVYFASFIIFFLVLTCRSVESYRWKQ